MKTTFFLSNHAQTILNTLSKWNVIVGLCLLVLAVVMVFASTPIVKKLTCADEKKGKILMICKIVGLFLAVVGALVACLF